MATPFAKPWRTLSWKVQAGRAKYPVDTDEACRITSSPTTLEWTGGSWASIAQTVFSSPMKWIHLMSGTRNSEACVHMQLTE
ncbi:unnamed protein product [Effrenium voratum]|nr:unnamed protein product [Effrenium voratum]